MSWLITPAFRNGVVVSDSDANAYLLAVETADGQPLEPAVAWAVDSFVVDCKSSGVWNAAAQLLLLSGPRTLAGSMIPLKGVTPTNVGFVSGDYNRKTGLGATSNTSKYVNSNVAKNVLGATSHALFAYGTITNASVDARLIGHFDGTTENTLLVLDEWATDTLASRRFRSATFTSGAYPTIISTASITCLIGSRTSSTSATVYSDGSSNTNASNRTLNVATSQPLFYYNLNANGAPGSGVYSSSKLQAAGIFSSGLNATQAASLRSATLTYVNALSAAIP